MKLFINHTAWQKIYYYVAECEDEISGLGKVLFDDKTGNITVTDVEIFEQNVSGGHSDIEPEALAKFLYEKTKAGEDLSEWRLWWHSHASMETFFSQTDTDTIDGSTEFDWLVSLVTNHKHEVLARFDLFRPFRLTNADIKVEILEDEDNEVRKQCVKEIEEKVTKSSAGFTYETPYTHKEFGYGGYRGEGYKQTLLDSPKEEWEDDLVTASEASEIESKLRSGAPLTNAEWNEIMEDDDVNQIRFKRDRGIRLSKKEKKILKKWETKYATSIGKGK